MIAPQETRHDQNMFEIYKSPKNKQFYFRLKARNHQVILASEGGLPKKTGR